MKKIILCLCLILIVLLIVWFVSNNSSSKIEKYHASELDNDVIIYDIDELESLAQ